MLVRVCLCFFVLESNNKPDFWESLLGVSFIFYLSLGDVHSLDNVAQKYFCCFCLCVFLVFYVKNSVKRFSPTRWSIRIDIVRYVYFCIFQNESIFSHENLFDFIWTFLKKNSNVSIWNLMGFHLSLDFSFQWNVIASSYSCFPFEIPCFSIISQVFTNKGVS